MKNATKILITGIVAVCYFTVMSITASWASAGNVNPATTVNAGTDTDQSYIASLPLNPPYYISSNKNTEILSRPSEPDVVRRNPGNICILNKVFGQITISLFNRNIAFLQEIDIDTGKKDGLFPFHYFW